MPAVAGDAAKPPRPRNEVFDAIVAVTGTDAKVNGPRIGVLCSLLAKADPPYTPAEVLRFADPEFLFREFHWVKSRPTIDQLQTHIGRARNPSPEPAVRPATGTGGFKSKREAADEYAATQMADGLNTLFRGTS